MLFFIARVILAKDSPKELYSNETSLVDNPACFSAFVDWSVNVVSLVITFPKTVPALEPFNPKSYNLESIAVVSSNDTPAFLATGATLANETCNFSIVAIDFATEFANISNILGESSKLISKDFTVDINNSVVLSKSSPTPTANFIACGIDAKTSCVFKPAEAILYIESDIF